MGKFIKLVSEEEQKKHFESYTKKLDKCTTYVALSKIAKDVISRGRKEGYIFGKEDADTFWENYNTKKEKLLPTHKENQAEAIKEAEEAIKNASTVKRLKDLKQGIFRAEVLNSNSVTKPLFDSCDQKIQENESSQKSA